MFPCTYTTRPSGWAAAKDTSPITTVIHTLTLNTFLIAHLFARQGRRQPYPRTPDKPPPPSPSSHTGLAHTHPPLPSSPRQRPRQPYPRPPDNPPPPSPSSHTGIAHTHPPFASTTACQSRAPTPPTPAAPPQPPNTPPPPTHTAS